MKPVRIFRHIDCEGPGYFADTLSNYNIPCEIVRIDQGEIPPSRLDDISGLVFMGGSMSVNDDLPWIEQELALIREAVGRDIPVLGHCLGGQLISKALGAKVTANPVREIGWLPVQKIPGDTSGDWLAGVEDNPLVFHWHGEVFSLPQGAEPILKSQHCPLQGFVIGNSLALQCHVEMTLEMVREWVNRFKDELPPYSETVQSPGIMLQDVETKILEMQAVADRLYERWLRAIL